MLHLKNITKGFPGVFALNDVSFSAQNGEIHALLGENGAGKSTLVKVIGGVYQPDQGQIELNDKVVRWSSPNHAKRSGIHLIHQELVMFPDLTVYENILLNEPSRTRFGTISSKTEKLKAVELLELLGHPIRPDAKMRDLSVADQQMVEIAKALQAKAKVLVLDEPTAVISNRETELLFERMRSLRENGVAIIYISHRLEEIFEIADRVTVLKDGGHIGTEVVGDLTREKMISMMVGREIADLFPPPRKVSESVEIRLEVKNLAVAPRVRDVSFQLRAGEILGLAGLVGSGRTEVAHAIFGISRLDEGTVTLDNEVLDELTPLTAIQRGIGFLTEDRKGEGLFHDKNLAVNITAPSLRELSSGLGLDLNQEREIADEAIKSFSVAGGKRDTIVGVLSGGNQQKVLFSRWARLCRKVLILDEPTRGVDVGAKVEIYRIISELADKGTSILMISSELPEVVGICDRVLVMREGVITGEVTGDDISEQNILHLAMLDAETISDDQSA